MSDQMNVEGRIYHQLIRRRHIGDLLPVNGCYPIIEHFDQYGKLLQRIEGMINGVTNVAKNYMLDSSFNAGTQIAANSWFLGFIDNTSFSALAAADTMASHAGWIEFTNYSQSTRVAWGQGSASGQAVQNGTPAQFDLTASGTLYGIFVTSNSTKGGTTGTLWATGAFPSGTVAVSNGDSFRVTYAVSL